MAPGQASIGKFFSNPNGAKAPAQQAKLSFVKKPEKSKAKEEAPLKEEEGIASIKPERQDEERVNANGHGAAKSSPTPRKRSVDEQAAESDDEPPTKRQRQKDARKSRSPSPRIKVEPTSTNGKTSPKSKAGKATSGAKASNIQPESSPPAAAVKMEEDEGRSAAEQDEEMESESEEERPEVAEKNRAKLQSVLKSSGKDPYPDWKAGDPVPYAALCTTFSLIEGTTKRLEMIAHCSQFLRQVLRLTPNDLVPTVLLMLGKLAADYSGVELGIGESLIMKAIGETTGRSLAIIKADQKEIGDLGLVAAKSRSNQPTMFKPKPLTVRGVHEGLMAIAVIEGSGSQTNKVGGIKKLLAAADIAAAGKKNAIDITKNKGGPSESKFIVRTLEGKMRLGLADKTVLVSLAHAMTAHDLLKKGENKIPSTDRIKNDEDILKSVYNELPSYEVIIPAYLKHGLKDLREHCKLQPGVPLKPMLARPTKAITEVLDRFEGKDFTCEYKYDGERAQIHFVAHSADEEFVTPVSAVGKNEKGVSNIFSRNSEDLSKKYPDILKRLPTWVKDGTKSFVLDCEAVAWDVKEKKVLPFQQLQTRKRKDVKTEDITVQVCVYAFDLLYLNGEAMVNKSFRERREAMLEALVPTEGELDFAVHRDTSDLDEIQVFLEESVKASCEGLMVKMLDGPASHYEPSRRSQNWLKVKKDYLAGAGDSLDLAVVGAYYGKGKRTGAYGAFLLACYNPSTQNLETVCKLGTGFSDENLADFHAKLRDLVIDRPKPFYEHSKAATHQPEVWFEPRYVWEVKFADLTLSPKYKAAADNVSAGGGGDAAATGRGVSLRFPRLIREREDKKPDDASTSAQVARMYKEQQVVSGAKKAAVDDDYEY